ncbi:hypothetical protein BHE74_00007522 [Ensete ventricosum]|nr:hypothetical protein BHE74_00007522 [Ensete ventricosum]
MSSIFVGYFPTLVAGHLQVTHPTVKLHRPFPVRNAQVHPSLWVDRLGDDLQLLAWNFHEIARAIGLPYTKHHQLFATIQVQGEPVPAGLAGAQRLAAPLAVEPGGAADLVGLAVDADTATGAEKRLAVVVGRLALVGFSAVALLALQHQGTAGGQVQVVGELRTTGLELHISQRACCARLSGKIPIVDPGIERHRLRAGLADPATGETLSRVVLGSGGDGRVPEPHRGIVPAGLSRPRLEGIAKQRPLHAEHVALGVLEVGGDVPPLDAKARMRAMVLGKAEDLAGHHLGKVRRVTAQASKTLRRRGGLVTGAQQ